VPQQKRKYEAFSLGTESELLHFRKVSNTGRKIICDEVADFVTDTFVTEFPGGVFKK
jgi:hypothetical protein